MTLLRTTVRFLRAGQRASPMRGPDSDSASPPPELRHDLPPGWALLGWTLGRPADREAGVPLPDARGWDGPVLVDTGLGTADLAEPRRRLGPLWFLYSRPLLDPEQTALAQVRRLGFAAVDVRHIVLTHLDLDHAGGLSDFPTAQVHVLDVEHTAAMQPPTTKEKRRYRQEQWEHQPRWVTHGGRGEQWMGFEAVAAIDNVLLVPLHGHTHSMPRWPYGSTRSGYCTAATPTTSFRDRAGAVVSSRARRVPATGGRRRPRTSEQSSAASRAAPQPRVGGRALLRPRSAGATSSERGHPCGVISDQRDDAPRQHRESSLRRLDARARVKASLGPRGAAHLLFAVRREVARIE